MHAKFECDGFISKAEVKASAKGNKFGRITVATGEAGFEFFCEPEDIESGNYAQGLAVMVTGTMGKRGFQVDLRADSIVVADAA